MANFVATAAVAGLNESGHICWPTIAPICVCTTEMAKCICIPIGKCVSVWVFAFPFCSPYLYNLYIVVIVAHSLPRGEYIGINITEPERLAKVLGNT